MTNPSYDTHPLGLHEGEQKTLPDGTKIVVCKYCGEICDWWEPK